MKSEKEIIKKIFNKFKDEHAKINKLGKYAKKGTEARIKDWIALPPELYEHIWKKKPKNKSIFGEMWSFMKIRKKFWLLPIIIMLLLAGILIILGQSSALSPFIYALF